MTAALSVFALAFALAMDAFAVALAHGARARMGAAQAVRIGAVFGTAQAVMPLAGWALGVAFVSIASWLDHWLALILLLFFGFRMVKEGLSGEAEEPSISARLMGWGLATAAFATSVDALAAGLALPAIEVPVLVACGAIGIVTALLCVGGVYLGRIASLRLGRGAEVAGGLLLMALGIKIFVHHHFFGG